MGVAQLAEQSITDCRFKALNSATEKIVISHFKTNLFEHCKKT
jgi:hypothetical protein